MSGWAAFWLFMAVYVVCETYLYDKGHETLFFKHKTDAELIIQQKQVSRDK